MSISKQIRVADKVFERLAQETSAVYYVPGGGSMFLVDALGRSRLTAVSMIHEQGAGIAAIGHAMATGGLGVCLTTSGPGATNALTACLAAWTDSVPVLFISGQARSEQINASKARARGLQYADIVRMAHPITKQAYEPMNTAHDCLMALDDMIKRCLTGRRGPCWLSIPQDVQGMMI
jgi:acetolactate synthase-1/2/3 large subunit